MSDPSPKQRVMIVESIPLIRFGLASLIELHPLLKIESEAGDAPEARERCAATRPDLAVVSLEVARGDGIELIRDLHRLYPPLRSVVMSRQEDALTVQRAFRSGARGYYSVRDEARDLLAAIEAVITGGLFASRRVSHFLLEELTISTTRGIKRQVAALSDRELQVFRLLGRELGNTAIARELGLSVKTIETHQQRMKEKLHVRTAAELHRCAGRWMARHRARA